MMLRTTWIALSMLFSLNVAAQTGGVRLWAVSDSFRIDPVDGRIFEARPDIHKDYPANDFRTANAVWDGTSRNVSLKAARIKALRMPSMPPSITATASLRLTCGEPL
jgi:hypothetical protein